MDEPNTPSKALDAISGVVPPAAQDKLKTDTATIAGEAQHALEAVKQEASDQASALKEQAQDQIAEATNKAKSFASEQKDVAGDQMEGVAAAISKLADDLASDQPMVAGYARDLAGGMKSVSEGMKSRNVDELIALTEDFGRRQPLAFLGAAALAGFVASRFVLASAQRRNGGAAASESTQASPGATRTSAFRGDF